MISDSTYKVGGSEEPSTIHVILSGTQIGRFGL